MKKSIEDIAANSVSDDGSLNDFGKNLLAKLLSHLPLIHRGTWGPVFIPLTRLLVRTNVDLALVDNGKVLMTWRDDPYYRGWHFPGGSLGPGESITEAAGRIAENELGIRIIVQEELAHFNNSDDPRSHNIGFFMLCSLDPKEMRPLKETGRRWFGKCPPDIIKVHEKNWISIKAHLGT